MIKFNNWITEVKLNSSKITRDGLIYRLRKRGIEASVHFYPPLHNQELYKKYRKAKDSLFVTEDICRKILTLPLYPDISRKELDFVVRSIKEVLCK